MDDSAYIYFIVAYKNIKILKYTFISLLSCNIS